ncbi:MAG: lipopolysaccharide biosynthesis protein RfbH [Candidatus Roizmanbacteria bacterium]|nr:lipopolysaccharide biosynthesis protein RfbH [Candidatus Roizmanbacteria bacterium]
MRAPLNSRYSKSNLTNKIHRYVTEYIQRYKSDEKFIPGKSVIRYAGAVYDESDINAMIDSLLEGWFGLGVQGEALEKELAEYIGSKQVYVTNSGSSADLLAIASLMSYQFPNHLNPGDEVITPACTFPTVIASLVHHRLVPVFVDVDLETLNPSAESIEKAITKKTKMIFLVHTLGNPNDMAPIMKLAKKHNLYVVEDNCDALGSLYDGKKTGTFGILGTESFYPAHHMTTGGEGGAVLINDLRLKRIVSSLREWGRACWCGASGGPKDGVCGVRFKFKIGDVPYDHKYIFNHIGYNLKPVEVQAAMGRVQLRKVDSFIRKRRKNFKTYHTFFSKYQDYFILPKALPNTNPSWFAFPMTIRKKAPFDRFTLINYLEDHLIQTRPMFAGNILKQPGYTRIKHKIAEPLPHSNLIFSNTFFIGVYPGIGKEQTDYVASVFDRFIKKHG